MKTTVLLFGSAFGALAIILGALGAHALQKHLQPAQLQSFETAVKYQMYHALLLVVLGLGLPWNSTLENWMGYCLIIGPILFSFSIYGLLWSGVKGNKWRFLGPITPLGGLLMVAGWVLLFLVCLEQFS